MPSGATAFGKAGARQGDHVHIAFGDDDTALVMRRLAGSRDVEQHPALVKQRRFRRIEIFRLLLLAERPAAKGDDLAARIGDRKHQPVAEPVIADGDVVARNQHAGGRHVVRGEAFCREMLLELVAALRSIAEAEAVNVRRGEAAPFEIGARIAAGGAAQGILEEHA